MNILIADDDTICRVILRALLENLNHNVDETKDGLELVTTFKNNITKYDVIFSDVMMPNMNGLAAIREIKKIRQLPCVAVTAFDNQTQLLDGDGKYVPWSICNFYMQKPISKVDLRTILEKISEIILSNQKKAP